MASVPRKDREEQKYIYLESVLHDINREYIALSEDEKRRNNVILNDVLKKIIEKMKHDPLFKKMFRIEFYGGSYFDNLKVGKPNEYDLDLLLDLPKFAQPTLHVSDIPGYVQIELKNLIGFLEQPYAVDYPGLARKLLDEKHFMSTDKALSWTESVLITAINKFPNLSEKYNKVKKIETTHGTFYFAVVKQGPAFTLKLYAIVNNNPVKMDIDLVPCFVFGADKWPKQPFRQNPFHEKPEFFIVPKNPENRNRQTSTYWRMSFQIQESVLIKDLQNLKPSLRLIKKLRDECDDKFIASYYLKTIFLWKGEVEQNIFWKKPLSYVFMTMLKIYQEYLESGNIPYFWYKENNLIKRINPDTLRNAANRLKRIINTVERHPENPSLITVYMAKPKKADRDFWDDIEDLPGIEKPCTLM